MAKPYSVFIQGVSYTANLELEETGQIHSQGYRKPSGGQGCVLDASGFPV